jgi:tRNA dimethylallyltransferase
VSDSGPLAVAPGFRERVFDLVRQIPRGRVMTYGQLAALCGNARAARIVGSIAHFGDPELPWQRVVNKSGGLASGYPGGRAGHAEALRSEGLEVSEEYRVDVEGLLWRPEMSSPLIVICGQTATGKSGLAMDLANKVNGEIICADSRTVYRGMDIGTAKPSAEDQKRVPHWGLDLVSLSERFTAADFKAYANNVIHDIYGRGRIPVMVGGTGLYIDSVIYDYDFRAPGEAGLREELSRLSVDELQERVSAMGLELPMNDRNPRHLIRVIETDGEVSRRGELRPDTLIMGLQTDREDLEPRIRARVEEMVQQGLVDEVRRLSEEYGWEAPGMQTIGYAEWREHTEGTRSVYETVDLVVKNTVGLAKRQKTWFRRNKSIHWLNMSGNNRERLAEAVALTTTLLNK